MERSVKNSMNENALKKDQVLVWSEERFTHNNHPGIKHLKLSSFQRIIVTFS